MQGKRRLRRKTKKKKAYLILWLMQFVTCVSCQNKSDHLIFKLLGLLFQK